MSIKEQLAAAATPKPFSFDVGSWGGEKVHLMPIDPEDFREHEEAMRDDDLSAVDVVISSVLHQLTDENGDRVFDLSDDGDVELARSFDLAGFYECWDALSERSMGKIQAKVEATKGNLRRARRKSRR